MSSGASGRVSEQMSAVERASNASKAKECAVRVNTLGGANGPVLYALKS